MLDITKLIHTQENLRSFSNLFNIVNEIKKNKEFLREHPVIVAHVEDNYYLHDGLHRSIAHYFNHDTHLEEGEYTIIEKTYDDYSYAAPENGWFTPMSLHTEVRSIDFMKYKLILKGTYERWGKDIFMDALNPHVVHRPWTTKRRFKTLGDFIKGNILC